MRTYQEALATRKLGSMLQLSLDDVPDACGRGEDLLRAGRDDEAVSRMVDLVEARGRAVRDGEDGRAVIFALADASRTRALTNRRARTCGSSSTNPGAWDKVAHTHRRAVRRLVEIGIESERYDDASTT